MAAATQGCANWSNKARPAPRKTAASRSTRQVSEAGPKTPSIDPAAASQTVSRLLSKSASDNNGMSLRSATDDGPTSPPDPSQSSICPVVIAGAPTEKYRCSIEDACVLRADIS